MTGSPLKEQKPRGASPPVPEKTSEYPQGCSTLLVEIQPKQGIFLIIG